MMNHIVEAQARLLRALHGCQSHVNCLRLWSAFIRIRDCNACLSCSGRRELAAHHIFRKSFLVKAQFEPGNGISLCRKCHGELHTGFNGRPDLNLPMDFQGGEKVEDISDMLRLLLQSRRQHPDHAEQWYYLSDFTLGAIKMLQGFDPGLAVEGSPLEQALALWNPGPRNMRDAVMLANGFTPPAGPINGLHVIFDEAQGDDGPLVSG